MRSKGIPWDSYSEDDDFPYEMFSDDEEYPMEVSSDDEEIPFDISSDGTTTDYSSSDGGFLYGGYSSDGSGSTDHTSDDEDYSPSDADDTSYDVDSMEEDDTSDNTSSSATKSSGGDDTEYDNDSYTSEDIQVTALPINHSDTTDDTSSHGSFTSPPTIPPSFRHIMTSNIASGMYPFVDNTFVAKHPDILQHSVIVILRLRDMSEYPYEVYKYQYEFKSKIYIETGWHYFCSAANIGEGDRLQFSLALRGIMPIFNVQIERTDE
ncbi:hypothetical protein ACFE04_028491 [Oxalis oulophora]